MKLTLDTNVLWDAADPARGEVRHKNARRLLDLHDEGTCEVYRTTRVDIDVPFSPAKDRINAIVRVPSPSFWKPYPVAVDLPGWRRPLNNGLQATIREKSIVPVATADPIIQAYVFDRVPDHRKLVLAPGPER